MAKFCLVGGFVVIAAVAVILWKRPQPAPAPASPEPPRPAATPIPTPPAPVEAPVRPQAPPAPPPPPTYAEILAPLSWNEVVRTLATVDGEVPKARDLLAQDKPQEARELYRSIRKALMEVGALGRQDLERFAAAAGRQTDEKSEKEMTAMYAKLMDSRRQLESVCGSPEAADETARAACTASEAADDVSDAIRDGKTEETQKALAKDFDKAYQALVEIVRGNTRR